MIPKRIFTVWLNKDDIIPEFIQRCIETHKIPGYEHRLITLENCFKDSKYMQECLNSPHLSKKWCKASDYLRMHYLLTEGGIYLDADVEVLPGKNFDNRVGSPFFVGKELSTETFTVLGTAVVGSEPGHPLVQEWMKAVEEGFRGDDTLCYESSMDLLNKIGVKYQDQMSILEPDYFYPYNNLTGESKFTDNTICIHHFAKTWTESRLDKFIFNIKNGINFSFVKRGDGEIACMTGQTGANCDGHPYGVELANELISAYSQLSSLPEVTIVDFDNQKEYNILLHRVDSELNKVRNFYKAIADSGRKVVFIAPERLKPISKLLNATEFIEVPLLNAYSSVHDLKEKLKREDNAIYVFCAGMLSKVLIAYLLEDRQIFMTCIDAGSAFDPYIGFTRTMQITQPEFEELYPELKSVPQNNFTIPQEFHPERLYAMAAVKKGLILDLGCGTHKTLPEAVGVDIRAVADLVGSIDKLPFGDNNADTIISRHSFEHMLDPVKTLREWIRILKPLGRLIVVLPDQGGINTMDPYYSNNEHMHAYTQESFRNFLELFPELQIDRQDVVMENWSFGTILTKYPKVSIIVPHLDRTEGLQRLLESIYALDYPSQAIEVIVSKGPESVPNKVQSSLSSATGEYICYMANDTEFTPSALREAIQVAVDQNKKLVAFNTGPLSEDEGNICEHFIIHRDLIHLLGGQIFDTRLHHCGVDNLLWARAKRLGHATRAETAVVHHYHWSKTGRYDDTYQRGWNRVTIDREKLGQILREEGLA